jgi:hypothetical protein
MSLPLQYDSAGSIYPTILGYVSRPPHLSNESTSISLSCPLLAAILKERTSNEE